MAAGAVYRRSVVAALALAGAVLFIVLAVGLLLIVAGAVIAVIGS